MLDAKNVKHLLKQDFTQIETKAILNPNRLKPKVIISPQTD